jgi:hypothetical protein
MTQGPDFCLTRFPAPARWTSRGAFTVAPWETLASGLTQPELWPAAQTPTLSEGELPGWSFTRFRDDARVAGRDAERSAVESARRAIDVHGVVVDYVDDPSVDAENVRRWWDGWAFVAYTSAFHEIPLGERPVGPRWRVLVPFTRPVAPEVAVQVGVWVRHPRRAAGLVDPAVLEPSRVVAVPAINPGKYQHTSGEGRALDPDVALAELAAWEDADRRRAAQGVLAGTPVAEALASLLATVARPEGRAAVGWPWPALDALAGGVPVGRPALILAAEPRLREAVLIAVAASAAASGRSVLLGVAVSSRAELAARLLSSGGFPASVDALLAGSVDRSALQRAAEALAARCPGLRVWTPGRGERSLAALEAEARALVDDGGAHPPVIVLDPAESWDEDHEVAGARRALAGLLGDIARPGGLGRGWPGAVVVVGATAAVPALGGGAALASAITERPGELGARLAAAVGELDAAAGLVLAVASDPGAAPRAATAAVIRAASGRVGAATLRWDPSTDVLVS